MEVRPPHSEMRFRLRARRLWDCLRAATSQRGRSPILTVTRPWCIRTLSSRSVPEDQPAPPVRQGRKDPSARRVPLVFRVRLVDWGHKAQMDNQAHWVSKVPLALLVLKGQPARAETLARPDLLDGPRRSAVRRPNPSEAKSK